MSYQDGYNRGKKEASQAGFGTGAGIATAGTVLAVVLIAGVLAGCPSYTVYNQRKHGEAQLAEALSSKQVAVQTARAKWESAEFEARAEVRRAEGVAQANRIIGDSLKNNESYLRYLYVNNLANSHDQIIYIPTEAGLPVLEAGRRTAPQQEQK